jgi:CRISPR-associated protein Cas2
MFTIISYDVVEDKRRTKVMKLLKGYGTRVQYSVFELDLDAQEFATIGREIRALIDLNTDSVRCYRLDAAAVQRITIHGIGTVSTEPSHWLV